jgi:hypothetical protein
LRLPAAPPEAPYAGSAGTAQAEDRCRFFVSRIVAHFQAEFIFNLYRDFAVSYYHPLMTGDLPLER